MKKFMIFAPWYVAVALAVQTNAITPGAPILSSTFESISVKAPFANDANGNAVPSIQYRKTGASAWLPAYTPLVDRRATIGGVVNPYANQARVSIVGLTPNTSYEVMVSWKDVDGVSAQPPLLTFSTLNPTPPQTGIVIVVTPSNLGAALLAVTPGRTLHLLPGAYAPFTVTRSGNGANYITIEGEPGAVISGANVAQNIRVSANFIVLRNLTLGPSDNSGIIVSANQHHVQIESNTIQNVSAKCAVNPAGHYTNAGISVTSGASNVYVLRNTVVSTSLANPLCQLTPIYASPGAGIQWGNVHSVVIADNTVKGAFRDAITLDSDFISENVDILRNTVSGNYRDDGIESKGGNVNVRMAGNTILTTGPGGLSCIAGNSYSAVTLYGPFYIYRNECKVANTYGSAGQLFKIGGAPVFVFHNSMDASAAPLFWDGIVNSGGNGRGTLVFLNNFMKLAGNSIASWGPGSILDFNAYWPTSSRNFVRSWNGTTPYVTKAAFTTATGQEKNGKVMAGLPALDTGVVIPNFNDLNSKWPYLGLAPDAGAIETK